MDRQALTGDTVLVKHREMTGRSQTLPWWLEEGRIYKDDRKQNTLTPLPCIIASLWLQQKAKANQGEFPVVLGVGNVAVQNTLRHWTPVFCRSLSYLDIYHIYAITPHHPEVQTELELLYRANQNKWMYAFNGPAQKHPSVSNTKYLYI
jgi:hypothetical protein